MKIQKFTAGTLIVLASAMGFAQTAEDSVHQNKVKQFEEELGSLKGQVEGLNESYLETKNTVDKLAKIKVSGLAQVQAVYAFDTAQQNSGNSLQQGKFEVRRGRLKVAYDNGKFGTYVMQFQFNEGGARTNDMYANFIDPWINTIGLQAGIQDIPFGYEIGHSSSSMETMERSLFERSIFKDEKDNGFLITVNPPKGLASQFNLKAGLFNHNGSSAENDDNKALIGRAGFKVPLYDLGLSIDGGFSFLYGRSQSRKDTVYNMDVDSSKVISRGNLAKNLKKSLIGADIQLYYDIVGLGGAILRAEMGMGDWVTNNGDNHLYSGSGYAYLRNVFGYYVTYVQNIGNDFQTVVRYESFDPNTHLEGKDISGKKFASKEDMARTQIGGGVNYFLNESVRLSLYYDHPINEKVPALSSKNLAKNFSKDVDDDVVTFRFQYKF